MPTLSDRLKAMGVQIGTKGLPPPQSNKSYPIEEVVAGRFIETGGGRTYIMEQDFPVDYIHGQVGLRITTRPLTIAEWAGEVRIADQDPEDIVFLDTETSGLAGGTGTFAFLIGVGRYNPEGFHLTHSATFPIDVPAICGLLTTREGDTILDCFTGTSTVGLFARSNNRKFVGYDMNPEFIKASEVRIGGLLYMPTNLEALEMSNIFSTLTTVEEIYSAFRNLTGTIKPISPELKKSFGGFSKAYNDCFRVFQKMR